MSRVQLSISLVLIVSCNEGGKGSATDDPSSGAPATTSSTGAPTSTSEAPTSTGDASSTSDGTTSDGTVTTDATTGSVTTGVSSGSTSETSSSTTSSTTGETTGGGAGQYAALWWSGGLNHLFVRKLEGGRCTTLSLAWPSQSPPGFTIALPDEWAVQAASINADQGECLSNWEPPPETVAAKGGTGTVEFDEGPMVFCPKTVDVDVVLSFAEMPDVPGEDVLQAVAVPVQGCE